MDLLLFFVFYSKLFFFFLKNSWHFDWNCIDSTNLFGESWHINTESSTHEHRVFLHLFRFSVSSFVDCDVLSFKESVLYLCYIFNGKLVMLPYYHFNVSRICHHFLFVFWYYISVFSHYSSSILLTVSQFLKTVFCFFFTETAFRFINFLFGPLNSLPRQDRSQIRGSLNFGRRALLV